MLLFFKDWHSVGKEPRKCKNSLLGSIYIKEDQAEN